MIIVRIVGGLGNQLFQYSFAKALSLKYNKKLFIDDSLFKHYQSIEEQSTIANSEIRDFQLKYFYISSKLLNKYFQHSIIKYKNDNFNNDLINKFIGKVFKFKVVTPDNYSLSMINQAKNVILEGYWQNQDIIEEYKLELLKEIKLNRPLPSKYSEIISEINSTNSIAVHVRRGDYIDNSIMKEKFVECNAEYYQKSLNYVDNNVDEPCYFVFSDDIEWSKKNLSLFGDIKFMDIDGLPYEHLSIMSQCKHQIIANSTFSWWAAWLNPNSSKLVLYPKNWYYDKALNENVIRIPSNWIEIENKI